MTASDEAVGYIKTHCPGIGSYQGDLSPYLFLRRVEHDIDAAKPSPLFPQRYKEHVACAVGMVGRHGFLEPPAAIASVYLATRFEFFFRLLSGKLRGDGTWLNKPVDQPAAVAALGPKGLEGKTRVSDLAVTYKLMKLNQSLPVAQVFDSLDRAILPTPVQVADKSYIKDVGDRIAYCRHSAGHGWQGDISSEAVFYGLVTAIIFYNQP